MMRITLVPFAGLGNRLNAISSAIALRERIGCEVEVQWPNTPDCQCEWSDLFEPIPGIPVYPLRKFHLIRRGRKYLGLPMLLRRFVFDGCFKARKIHDKDFLLKPDCRYRNIYIDANRPFCPLPLPKMVSPYFRPIPELEQRIHKVTDKFDRYTVGVHIRRTDHSVVIAANPIEGFIKRMREQLSAHSECLFYVATDDEAVKGMLRKEFPGRIITQSSVVLRRDSVKGMKDAVVEMFTLGRTHAIISSQGSTFSELAARLYDIPNDYRPNTRKQ